MPDRKKRMTLRLGPQEQRDLAYLCTSTKTKPTSLINHLIHGTRVELEVMAGAFDLYGARLADNPEATLPRIDLIVARMLTRILQSRNFLPKNLNLRTNI
jgi:hypothetical protein